MDSHNQNLKRTVAKAYSRAGLLGNPSDGFGGKTISLIVKNFSAEVVVSPDSLVRIIPSPDDAPVYRTVYDMIGQIEENGYYGGTRILKATIKRFIEFVNEYHDPSCDQGFSISFRTNIPRNVGLAGSSAIVVATLKALCRFFEVDINPSVLASLALSVERDELGIPAGLQDRVIQSFEGVVYMDFSSMQQQQDLQIGTYEELKAPDMPALYIAYGDRAGEPTEMLHGDLRTRFDNGDSTVVEAMKRFAEFAERGKEAFSNSDHVMLHELINGNFNLRQSICDLNPFHIEMVETARSVGASAKFCGSGGAIIGTFADDTMLERLKLALNSIGCNLILPIVH